MLTVLLSTRDRAAILQKTLESFCCLQRPSSGWKLVVVDNGSTDGTSAVLASFANRLPLHMVSDPAAGKNAALNAGLAFVEGDLTVLTDDDIFPRADWLIELRNAADTQPGYSMFGGSIVPRWEIPPPAWIEWVEKGPMYGLTDSSMKEGEIRPLLVFGGNMAVRSALFQSGIRFDTSVGPRSSSYRMGSETELTLRLNRQGHKAWYVPGAVVEHFIRDYQMREPWVLQRAIRYGRGCFRLWHAETWEPVTTFGIPRYYLRQMNLVRQILQEELKVLTARLGSDHRQFFSARWQRNFLWGVVTEAHLWHRLPGSEQDKPLPGNSEVGAATSKL